MQKKEKLTGLSLGFRIIDKDGQRLVGPSGPKLSPVLSSAICYEPGSI